MNHKKLYIISLFILALAIRIFLIPNKSFEADITFWKSWGLAVVDFGAVNSFSVTNNNYPTPFSYLLGGMTFLYGLFADPHNFNQYWLNSNVLFLLIAKLPAIISDFGIAGIILWCGKKRKSIGFPDIPMQYYVVGALLYLFNPLSIIDGAWWGQVDSFGVLLFLIAILFTLKNKPFVAGFFFMVSMMMKMQNMIYGPVFFILMWQLYGFGGLVKSLAGALCSFVFLNIQFLFLGKTSVVIGQITQNYNYFPFLSLNAFNPWWIVAGGHGMQFSDKLLSFGIINAKTMGLMLFSTSYLLAVLMMMKDTIDNIFSNKNNKAGGAGRGAPTKGSPCGYSWEKACDRTRLLINDEAFHQKTLFNFFTALIIIAASFFLFQTESHERYAFPIAVFAIFWGLFYCSQHPNRQRSFLIGYTCFSLIYVVNLHDVLFWNYPKNSIEALSFLGAIPITITISSLLTTLFVFFLFVNRKEIGIIGFSVPTLLFGAFCVFTNLPLITKSPVSLTKFTPYISRQDYGSMVIDMPVNASGTSKQWNRLSVQYVFYRKGIGTHATSYIVYDIGGHFKTLSTDMGIDTEGGPQGSVVFAVYGDDKLLYRSEVIKRYEYPRHADIDITGVKKLSLVVEDGGNGITDDHADWLNPTLWP